MHLGFIKCAICIKVDWGKQCKHFCGINCCLMDAYLPIIIIALLVSILPVFGDYNRTLLQEKYPGFGDDYIFFPKEDGTFKVGYLIAPEGSPRTLGFDLERDVFFTLYTRQLPDGFKLTQASQVPKYFDPSKNTIFVTHGWMSSGRKLTCTSIKDGYLRKEDVNVFIMDWSHIAGNIFYPIPMGATSDLGDHYAKFLNDLVKNKSVSPSKIHLIGHSLGAHVSGFAGRGVETGKIGRITALDPALPGFTSNIELVRGGKLRQTDADFVDVIHTCAGFLGLKEPVGHVDFYPNGGLPPQPGCSILEVLETCSHGTSWKIYAESLVRSEPYMASKCASLDLVWQNHCDGDDIPMGDPTPLDARGIYYSKTDGEFHIDNIL